MFRQLDSRENDGITVSLYWNDSAKDRPEEAEFQVEVFDVKDTQYFTLSIDTFENAREAYFHPFAVANRYLKSGKIAA